LKISKEVKTGILVVVSVALFIYGFNFLKGNDLFNSQTTIYARYSNAAGLLESNPVQLNGFKVGIIKRIELQQDGSSASWMVTMLVNNDVKVPKNTIARISTPGLLSAVIIDLKLGDAKVLVENGDTLKTEIEEDLKTAVNKQIAPLKEKAEGLIASIDSVMIVVQAILNKNARENLTKSFESIKRALATFEKTSLRLDTLVASQQHKISRIFSKVEIITNTLANNNDKLTNILTNFSEISDSLAKSNITATINNANLALSGAAGILGKINRGEGSVGLLIDSDSLYKKLDASADGLDKLMIDLKENPGRYIHFSVFGKKDKKKPKK